MFGLSGSNPVMVDIDTPSPNGQYGGQFALNGWAVGGNGPIASVLLSLDGTQLGLADYGDSRPDVQASFPGNPGGSAVGWHSSLSTINLANGTHSLTATATDSTGATNSTTQNFTILNNAPVNTTDTVIPTVFSPVSSGSTSQPISITTNSSSIPTTITTAASTSIFSNPLILIAGAGILLLTLFGGTTHD